MSLRRALFPDISFLLSRSRDNVDNFGQMEFFNGSSLSSSYVFQGLEQKQHYITLPYILVLYVLLLFLIAFLISPSLLPLQIHIPMLLLADFPPFFISFPLLSLYDSTSVTASSSSGLEWVKPQFYPFTIIMHYSKETERKCIY